jgi:hypothetical protein
MGHRKLSLEISSSGKKLLWLLSGGLSQPLEQQFVTGPTQVVMGHPCAADESIDSAAVATCRGFVKLPAVVTFYGLRHLFLHRRKDGGAEAFAIGEVDSFDVGQQDEPVGEGFPAVGAAHGG